MFAANFQNKLTMKLLYLYDIIVSCLQKNGIKIISTQEECWAKNTQKKRD